MTEPEHTSAARTVIWNTPASHGDRPPKTAPTNAPGSTTRPVVRVWSVSGTRPVHADSRAMLELYAGQPLDQGQILVENGALLGALPTGGFDTITANPASEADLDEEALDHAAIESGAD